MQVRHLKRGTHGAVATQRLVSGAAAAVSAPSCLCAAAPCWPPLQQPHNNNRKLFILALKMRSHNILDRFPLPERRRSAFPPPRCVFWWQGANGTPLKPPVVEWLRTTDIIAVLMSSYPLGTSSEPTVNSFTLWLLGFEGLSL